MGGGRGVSYYYFIKCRISVCVWEQRWRRRERDLTPSTKGAPTAQWVVCWPTDLAVLGSSPARGGDLFDHKWGSTAQAFHYHPPTVLI